MADFSSRLLGNGWGFPLRRSPRSKGGWRIMSSGAVPAANSAVGSSSPIRLPRTGQGAK
jgi:hypothetical protein